MVVVYMPPSTHHHCHNTTHCLPQLTTTVTTPLTASLNSPPLSQHHSLPPSTPHHCHNTTHSLPQLPTTAITNFPRDTSG
ncbi:hypothetical protein Pmani_038540 [Petrolisthes manimaculis]|uniref:Uncharacterized protein n=1 Tax=Petrolisthes manimaculis TaxID=1843537 RepID=A0AAE1TM69_9EUCA|nr:hypothetical protein Pmani_038540 [Petrolisthes manimaculis]